MTPIRLARRRAWLAALGGWALAAALATPAWSAPTAPAAFDYERAPKFALVIGNQRYTQWPALHNAQNDARLMADTFRALGYQTTLVVNADARGLRQSLAQFSDQLSRGGVGALYYAGHGVQSGGRNYLLPTDMPTGSAATATTGLPVDELLKVLRHSGAQASLILLDACRNDPLDGQAPKRWRGAGSEGFAEPTRVPPGMLVAYATQPGERALDGSGRNSPFATALARWLPEPNLRLTDAMEQVKRQVRADTQDDQRPLVESSLVTDFPLTKRALPAVAVSSPSPSPKAVTPPTPMPWYMGPDLNRLMLLTTEIQRRARSVNVDDLPLLEHQARRGSVMAQAVLGTAWRQGFGVGLHQQRSAVKARKWLGLAAAQHMPYALNELGEMVYRGEGAPKQADRASQLFEVAARLGYTPARLNLLQVQLESGLSTPDKLPQVLRPFNPASP